MQFAGRSFFYLPSAFTYKLWATVILHTSTSSTEGFFAAPENPHANLSRWISSNGNVYIEEKFQAIHDASENPKQ